MNKFPEFHKIKPNGVNSYSEVVIVENGHFVATNAHVLIHVKCSDHIEDAEHLEGLAFTMTSMRAIALTKWVKRVATPEGVRMVDKQGATVLVPWDYKLHSIGGARRSYVPKHVNPAGTNNWQAEVLFYPDWPSVIPHVEHSGQVSLLGIDAGALSCVSSCLGSDKVTLRVTGSQEHASGHMVTQRAIIITHIDAPEGNTNYAILMPLYISESWVNQHPMQERVAS